MALTSGAGGASLYLASYTAIAGGDSYLDVYVMGTPLRFTGLSIKSGKQSFPATFIKNLSIVLILGPGVMLSCDESRNFWVC